MDAGIAWSKGGTIRRARINSSNFVDLYYRARRIHVKRFSALFRQKRPGGLLL
jgi:hypothetical protein